MASSTLVGSFGGKLTGGFGLQEGRMQLSYGFTGRYAEDLPGEGARTAHALEATVSF